MFRRGGPQVREREREPADKTCSDNEGSSGPGLCVLFLGLRRAPSPAGTLLSKPSPGVDGGGAVEDAPFGGILISSAICVYFWEACVPGWPLPRDSLMETAA